MHFFKTHRNSKHRGETIQDSPITASFQQTAPQPVQTATPFQQTTPLSNQLQLEQISKSYENHLALHDISFTLKEGIYGLLGPNGAGKSTFMNVITGNLRPTAGTILWNGRDIQTLGAAYRSVIGYAPQQQGLYDTFTGRRFLSYMAALKGIPTKKMVAEIQRVLHYVNLLDVANHPIGTYSGGMKQRLLIAQALLGDPKLIILDEPTAGLDPKERVRIREKIQAISGNKIILVSTHVVSDIESIATEILLLKSGSIVDHGSVQSLCKRYGNTADLEEVYLHIFGEEEIENAFSPL